MEGVGVYDRSEKREGLRLVHVFPKTYYLTTMLDGNVVKIEVEKRSTVLYYQYYK